MRLSKLVPFGKTKALLQDFEESQLMSLCPSLERRNRQKLVKMEVTCLVVSGDTKEVGH